MSISNMFFTHYNAFIDCVGNLACELSFLSKATEANSMHPYMSEIKVEASESGEGELRGLTTDGKRLHMVDPIDKSAKDFGLSPGYWHIFKKTERLIWAARICDEQTKDWNFFNIQRVMPSTEPEYRTEFLGFCLKYYSKRNFGDLAKFLHDFPEVTAINLEYLHDLGMNTTWKVEWYGAHKALKFSAGNRMALIMPMEF